MTRYICKQVPKTMDGKELRFEELYRSNFHQLTRGDALSILQSIREAHPESAGWYEFDAFVEQDPDTGKWRAVRHHAQYR